MCGINASVCPILELGLSTMLRSIYVNISASANYSDLEHFRTCYTLRSNISASVVTFFSQHSRGWCCFFAVILSTHADMFILKIRGTVPQSLEYLNQNLFVWVLYPDCLASNSIRKVYTSEFELQMQTVLSACKQAWMLQWKAPQKCHKSLLVRMGGGGCVHQI